MLDIYYLSPPPPILSMWCLVRWRHCTHDSVFLSFYLCLCPSLLPHPTPLLIQCHLSFSWLPLPPPPPNQSHFCLSLGSFMAVHAGWYFKLSILLSPLLCLLVPPSTCVSRGVGHWREAVPGSAHTASAIVLTVQQSLLQPSLWAHTLHGWTGIHTFECQFRDGWENSLDGPWTAMEIGKWWAMDGHGDRRMTFMGHGQPCW